MSDYLKPLQARQEFVQSVSQSFRMATQTPTKKRLVLTLEQRVKVIKAAENGETTRKIADRFSVGRTQVQQILKNKVKILEDFQKGSCASGRKYLTPRKTSNDTLNRIVFEWFCGVRSKGLPVSGRILQERALCFSVELGLENFTASNGWLECFKRRNIKLSVMCGEAADVDNAVIDDWKERAKYNVEGYDMRDIFNADKTGLLYRSLPNKTLSMKGEHCSGGKKNK